MTRSVFNHRRARASSRYRDAVLLSGPELYWRLGEPASDPLAFDSSGHGHTGTYTGAITREVPTPIEDDPGVTFGADDAYVLSAPSTAWDVADFTVEMLVYCLWPFFATNGTPTLVAVADGTSRRWGLFIDTAVSSQLLRAATGGGAVTIATNVIPRPSAQAWTHLVVTRDSATAKFAAFVAGRPVGTPGNPGSLLATNKPFSAGDSILGGFGWGTAPDGDGSGLDEVALYTRVLPLSEIIDHFNASDTGPPLVVLSTDSFNRPDGVMGSTDGHGTLDPAGWYPLTVPAMAIAGGKAVSPGAGAHGSFIDAGSPDVAASAVLSGTLASGSSRLIIRAGDYNHCIYGLTHGGAIGIWQDNAGATTLAVSSIVPVAGDRVTLSAKGNVISYLVNGSVGCTFTTSFQNTSTQVGMDIFGTGAAAYDEWVLTTT